MRLEARELTVTVPGRTLVDRVSLTVSDGDWLMLIGPNGAGKTTLLNALSCALPSAGELTLDGEPLRAMRPAQRARRIGMLSQLTRFADGYTVDEMVALGRYSRRGAFGRPEPDAQTHIDAALEATGLTPLRARRVNTLSGGEQQRVALAQALCQEPSLLLLDEPANHLDLDFQQQLFRLVDAWRQQPGRAVISVVHDLSQARRFGTQALLMADSRCVAYGSPAEVMTGRCMDPAWHMDVLGWVGELQAAWQR